MTKVTLLKDQQDKFYGFEATGHAGFAGYGRDIVCAAVSVLLINTANSLEELLSKDVSSTQDPKAGFLEIKVTDYDDPDVQLLFRSLELGLKEIAGEHPKNLNLTNRRCNP